MRSSGFLAKSRRPVYWTKVQYAGFLRFTILETIRIYEGSVSKHDFVSGLFLLFECPIHVGDTVEVGNLQGTVRRIGIRASVVTWNTEYSFHCWRSVYFSACSSSRKSAGASAGGGSVSEYPQLALTGLLTFFGSLNAAVPFLLDLFRIPADTFQLFLATGVINPARIIRYVVITLVLSAAVLGGLRTLLNTALKQSFAGEELVYGMRSLMNFSEPRIIKQADLRDDADTATSSILNAIKKRGGRRVARWRRLILMVQR